MKYRAIVVPTTGERALQNFSSSRAEVEEWARKIAPGLPEGSSVMVYETTELLVGTITKHEEGTA